MKERGEEEDMPLDNPRVGALRSCIKIPAIKLVRLHMIDWMVLAFLIAMEVLLNWIEPFHRFVGDGMMETLRYPLKANTVPVWAVGVLAILGPMIIITGIYIKKRNEYDLHHAILGLLFSVLITGVLTDAIKDGVGRPRPNFYWRCFPNGIPSFKNVTAEVLCHGDEAVVKEGYKSFPSGHSSWSFAGLGFLSWYLAGKIRAFDRQGHAAKLCIVLLPLLLAALVAISRVSDYWHHWQDVCTGGILGAVVATLCYLHFFPSPAGEEGQWPHAYFCNFLNKETHYQMHSTTTSNDDESRQRPSQEHVEVEIRSNS